MRPSIAFASLGLMPAACTSTTMSPSLGRFAPNSTRSTRMASADAAFCAMLSTFAMSARGEAQHRARLGGARDRGAEVLQDAARLRDELRVRFRQHALREV